MTTRQLLYRLIPFLLAGLCIVASPRVATAQSDVAWTTCRGNIVQTFVNVGVLGTDSAQEILRHEEVHRGQAKQYIDSLGVCPPLSEQQVLVIETQAYCASDSVRVQVKKTPPFEASAISLNRLLSQFYPSLTADTVVAVWKRECP